jgi:hypothetical protein
MPIHNLSFIGCAIAGRLIERFEGEFSGCGCITAYGEVTPLNSSMRFFSIGDHTIKEVDIAESGFPSCNPAITNRTTDKIDAGQINTSTGAAGPWIFVPANGYPMSKIAHGQSTTTMARNTRPCLPRCRAQPMTAVQQHNPAKAPITKIAPS